MWKKVWFQSHWLLGISAGLVLALVGVTGAMLSFEQEILRWLNPEVMTVQPGEHAALSPAELVQRVQAAAPDKVIIGLTLNAEPTAAAQVGFAGGRRGEWQYLDPYTGTLLGKAERGETVLHVAEDLHRRLAGGEVGKQVVGACTVALLVLALSGLYLRWPRRAGDWRAWLTLRWSRQGRSFLWDLHAVLGTWLLPLYLVAALTGLYWSYDWYRDGLFALTGAPRPAPVAQASVPGPAAPASGERNHQSTAVPFAPIAFDRLWQVAQREMPAGYQSITVRVPERSGQPIELRYLDATPAHGRASNTLKLDRHTLAVISHERYDALAAGGKLMRSMFALHSGSFFGVTGLLLMMIASLLMPVFAVTGWLLYLDRRRKRRAARAAAKQLNPDQQSPQAGNPMLISYASQTGFAEQLAWQTARLLQSIGIPVQVASLATLTPAQLQRTDQALFVVSTFGDGEAPDGARPFVKRLLGDASALPAGALQSLRFAVLALGDRQYPSFCGFGQRVEQWLRAHGATPLFEAVQVDRADPAALTAWQIQLQRLIGVANIPVDRLQPTDALLRWQLLARQHLNPGSAGAAIYRLTLKPATAADAFVWQAGDLIDVLPEQPAETVREIRYALGLPADALIGGETVESLLARSERPTVTDAHKWRAQPDAELRQRLRPLSLRSYSIGSIAGDGVIDLWVRQHRRDDGSLGLGSGWLTAHLPIGGSVALQWHRNAGFHCENYQRPLILIGNGSGWAGLRSHLCAAAAAGSKGHWLLFGERSRQADHYIAAEVESWQQTGVLSRVDLAFSRDQPENPYVQHHLRAAAPLLRQYLNKGASIYVCGSATGMAPAVEQVLVDVLGSDAVSALLDEGRYRRDVY